MSISDRLDKIEGRNLSYDVDDLLAALRAVLDVCDRTEASIEPRGDFETGQASVTATIRAVIAAALGEDTP